MVDGLNRIGRRLLLQYLWIPTRYELLMFVAAIESFDLVSSRYRFKMGGWVEGRKVIARSETFTQIPYSSSSSYLQAREKQQFISDLKQKRLLSSRLPSTFSHSLLDASTFQDSRD